MYNEDLVKGLIGGSILAIIIVCIIALSLVIINIIAQWKLFKKAGKKGWEAIIPFYNTWTLIEISGLHWWHFLLTVSGTILSILKIENLGWITSIAEYFTYFSIYYYLAKKTHKNEVLYGVLGIFMPFVPNVILGFSKDITIDNNVEVNPNGIIGENLKK